MLKALVCWDQHRYLPWIWLPIIADLLARLWVAVWADSTGHETMLACFQDNVVGTRRSGAMIALWPFVSINVSHEPNKLG